MPSRRASAPARTTVHFENTLKEFSMKFLSSQITLFMQERGVRRNIAYLMKFLALVVFMIVVYSVVFHYIMRYEGESYSWITGVYWTLTVMSTLGFGDITFNSDPGKIFSILVLMSGVFFLLVMLPFTFIQYFYAPWLEAQKKDRAARSLPQGTRGHVVLVGTDPLVQNLADDLTRYGVRSVLLCGDAQTALDLGDQGYQTVVGEHDNGDVYRRLRIADAAMLVTLDTDMRNTSIAFTVRDVDAHVPITARAENTDSIDILYLAGCTSVFQFHKLLGEALARRILSGKNRAGTISRFGELVLAEAPAMRTSLVGKTVRDSGLRSSIGINVVGIWERGKFSLPQPDTVFTDTTVLVVAGTEAQIHAFDNLLGEDRPQHENSRVLILGGGRVGQAAARYLETRQQRYCVVDKEGNFPPSREDAENMVHGDASDLEILEKAGIRDAPSVIITTHDDDTNIYLTIYCRRLRPDIQIISRATLDRNVGILHAAGADLVLSLASMVTSSVINLLSPGKTFMLNEGLNIFRSIADERLAGLQLLSSGIRDRTNCSVVGVRSKEGVLHINPSPEYTFEKDDEIYLIGDSQAERAYYERYGQGQELLSAEEGD